MKRISRTTAVLLSVFFTMLCFSAAASFSYAESANEGSVDVELTGEVTLTNRDMSSQMSFDFTLKAGDELTQKAIKEKDIILKKKDTSIDGLKEGKKGTFSFGTATFRKEGEYTFIVAQNMDLKGGITCDQTEKTLKVEVTKRNNELKAQQTNVPSFKNDYEAVGEYYAGFRRMSFQSSGGTLLPIKTGQFTFSLYYDGHEDEKPISTTGVIGKGTIGEIAFDTIPYTSSQLEVRRIDKKRVCRKRNGWQCYKVSN